MCTHMCMATKNISIMDDVYKLLSLRKMVNESFSDVIRRELNKKRSIMEFAGAWKDMSDKDAEELKNNVKKIRQNLGKSLLKKSRSN